MTTADRLRAAVEAALPDGWLVLKPGFDDFREADSGLREIVLAAVLPIVEEREAELAALREKLAGCDADLIALRTAVRKHAAEMESWRDRFPNARLGRWCISELRAIVANREKEKP